ncbi:MAG: M23 family metallopeptidase [Oscillospiraceae bacterium]|nr:M23 family metallopeptidase [Oscillospiraceae bacterium]
MRLSVCVGIFLSLWLIKLFDPPGAHLLGETVNAYIGDDTPSAIRTLGQALSDGESIVGAFKSVITGVPPEAASAAEEEDESAMYGKTPDPAWPLSLIKREDTAATAGVPFAAVTLDAGGVENRAGMEARPYEISPVVMYEGELISGGGFGVDDTLPLPFGYDAPPNVDFSRYTFEFEYVTPLRGEMTSRFGYREHPVQGGPLFHYGVDIAAAKGTDILSFAAGTVTGTGKSDTYGNYVLIAHGEGVSSFYAHCDKVLVKRGAKVGAGQAVARVGSTGVSTGPHLHFELRLDGKLIDPEFYI